MSALKRRIALVSVVLMFPAIFLSVSGVLYVALGMDGANHLLELVMANVVGKALLSPVVVLGGPLAVFALNTWRVVHLSAGVVNEEFVIALSVKRLFSHLVFMALAAGLLGLLLAYAFAENFQFVAR
jgi:hypothetical protein